MRKAFSLFELLVVIAVIGAIYLLAFNSLTPSAKKEKNLDIKGMKEFLTQKYGVGIELICIEGCQRCYIKSNEEMKEIEQTFGLKENLDVYFIDNNYREFRIEFDDFADNEVCLKYKISKKGVSEPQIIQNGDTFYTLPSFIGSVRGFESMNDAIEWQTKEKYGLEEVY